MSAMDDLPPLRDVIRRHDLSARKSLGQNFLLDLNLTAKIARASGNLEGATVVEIGPGPGGLTRALLALGARKVIAIEKDSRAVAALSEIAARYPERLEVIEGDALTVDIQSRLDRKARIVANLPYNVATLLLGGWLTADPWPSWWESLTLMFQKEVAERITAEPGSHAYGRLGVLCGWRTVSKMMFDVPPSAFVPPPKITSTVVHIVPRPEPYECRARDLEIVTQAAFGQRRKMLRQSLKSIFPEPESVLESVGISPTARAETVGIEGFAALARAKAEASS